MSHAARARLAVAIPVGIGALVAAGYLLLRGTPAAPYLRQADAAPVPSGAVRYEHSARNGTFEIGPRVRVAYRLVAGSRPSAACVKTVGELRGAGWTLRSWGEQPHPLPAEVAAFCSPADSATVLFTAARDGRQVTVLLQPGVLAYSAP